MVFIKLAIRTKTTLSTPRKHLYFSRSCPICPLTD